MASLLGSMTTMRVSNETISSSTTPMEVQVDISIAHQPPSPPAPPPSSSDPSRASATRPASTNAPDPLLSFNLFPALPTELRLKIWNHALLLPRVIEVRARETLDETQHRTPPMLAPFALLRACRESREETQKNYPFGNLGRFWQRGWWVNWETDVFYLDFSTCVKFNDDFESAGKARRFIRHLVLPSRLFAMHPRNYADTLLFMVFGCVEDVTVVMVEGPRTLSAAELITLERAAERNHVAARLVGSPEICELESRLLEFKKRVGKRWPARHVPEFRLMAMDRLDGVNMANSFISFRI